MHHWVDLAVLRKLEPISYSSHPLQHAEGAKIYLKLSF
jgi:hypothetical protein